MVISDQGVELKIGEGNLSFLLSSVLFEMFREKKSFIAYVPFDDSLLHTLFLLVRTMQASKNS